MLGAGAKTDSAVSPVIGVMLLLAIVIIIAALVASFAGGAADTKEKAPSVDPAVYTAGSGQNFTPRLRAPGRGPSQDRGPQGQHLGPPAGRRSSSCVA